MNKRIIVGISGASGIPVAVEILRAIQKSDGCESHLVISESAGRTLQYEGGVNIQELEELAACVYDFQDIGASIASGTFQNEGMIIVPCSMKTAAGVTCGYTDNLLLRAADVVLKERRKLVMMVRECPLNRIHLRNLLTLSELGADIMPLVMTFYNHPDTIEDMVRHMAGKALGRFGIEIPGFRRWGEESANER